MNMKVIEYQTHQELTNKNSLNKMNRQLQKIETPRNQTAHNKTTQSKYYHRKEK